MSLQDDFRKAQGKAESAVDQYGDKANEAVQPFLRKHGWKIAVGIAVLGGLLFLFRGF
jgi:hypothetical protein